MPGPVSSNLYREQMYREGKFACDLCNQYWPNSHKRIQSGNVVGAMCDWEPEGGEIERDERRAMANQIAARLSAKEQEPPVNTGITLLAPDSYIVSISPERVTLVRGGAAVAVTLTGIGFVAADVIVYGNAGITDDSAPVLVSDVSRTLAVEASGGMAVGLYTMTFNGTVWQAVFDVR